MTLAALSKILKEKATSRPFRAGALVSVILIGSLMAFFYFHTRFIRSQAPEFLTFPELQKLSQNPHPVGLLGWKLEKFWTTPILSNQAYYEGVRPSPSKDPRLGPTLHLASWNIEKSIQMKDAITVFASAEEFGALIDLEKAPEGSEEYKTILRQRERLAKADVILLQEMDIGVKRSGYINAAKDLAEALKMNYAYAPEQLEIDPVYLGLEEIVYSDGTVDREQTDFYAADPARYKGAFGTAVLSRYPIKSAKAFQLKNVAYDWYEGEKSKPGFVEKARQAGAEVLFHNQFTREMKAGGRTFFRVDLAVPGLPEDTLTIINIHLEIKCTPKEREAQTAEILAHIKHIKHPVVMMGDFNAAPEDLSPTSAMRIAERTIKSPTTWLNVAVTALLPQALIINASRFVSNFTKNRDDPLAPDIAVIAPNPLHPLFQMIQNFRFSDGGAFDFRGDSGRAMNGKTGALANSNERDLKGFKTSWSVDRPISFIGKYRLDWVFVKSAYLKDPYNKDAPYRMAPHFGETLEELNTGLKVPVSDHHPNVVDLPFKEPKFEEPAPPPPAPS